MPLDIPQTPISRSIPILERIARNIFDTVNNIQRANGYAQTLIVERRKQPHNEPGDLKAVIGQGDPSFITDRPQLVHEWMQPFTVAVNIIDSEESPYQADTRSNQVAADVMKVLKVDRTRGGMAINTIIREPEFFPDGVSVNFDVHYRTLIYDPFSTPETPDVPTPPVPSAPTGPVIGDNTLFTDDPSRQAIQPTIYFRSLDPTYWSTGIGDGYGIDETTARASARFWYDSGVTNVVLDMEYGGPSGYQFYFLDAWAGGAPQAEVDASIAAAIQVADWMRDERSGLRIGFYGWCGGLFVQNISGTVNFAPTHVDFDATYLETMVTHFDYINPQLYLPIGYSIATWCEVASRVMATCARFNKPIYPYISHRLAGVPANALVTVDYWQVMWQQFIASADGAVWFSGQDTTTPSQAYIDYVRTLI